MATEFNTRIKFKRDTSSNWTNKNPVILNGEIILVDTESGELRAKVGDGVKSYTQLPFSDEVIRNLIPTDLSELNQDSTHRLVTDSEKQTWNNKSDFDGDYYSLTSRPSIPTQLSQLSSDSTHRLVTDTEKNIWNNKSDFNGNYNNLTNKPSIPTVSTSVTSTSATTAASSSAVKNAYDKATAAMPKSGGTFTGSVYAGNSYQSYSLSLLRNSKLVSSETTPTYNGEIYWVYG